VRGHSARCLARLRKGAKRRVAEFSNDATLPSSSADSMGFGNIQCLVVSILEFACHAVVVQGWGGGGPGGGGRGGGGVEGGRGGGGGEGGGEGRRMPFRPCGEDGG